MQQLLVAWLWRNINVTESVQISTMCVAAAADVLEPYLTATDRSATFSAHRNRNGPKPLRPAVINNSVYRLPSFKSVRLQPYV